MDTCIESQQVKPFICDLINLIYQAALQPRLWPEALSDIRILCGADQCTLFFYDALEPSRCLVSAARADEEILNRYLKNSIKQQALEINTRLKTLPEGQVATDQDIRRFAGEEYSEIVGPDYMRTFWPNLRFEAGIVLLRGETSCAGLGLQNFDSSPALQPQNIRLLQTLSPHLNQAMRLHQEFTKFKYINDALRSVLERSKIGIILIDEKSTLQFINHKARLSIEKMENLNQSLVLEKINREHIQKIIVQSTLTLACHPKTALNSDDLKMVYKNGHLKIKGYILHSDAKETDEKIFPFSEFGYLLLICDSNPTCELGEGYLHSAYEITATERKLILGLINGATLRDNADSQTVKPSTIRWHLKNIMQKTATHSQTELTRLMLELRE
ncbi:MAG: hypothetical protein EOO52_14350 [Gammaproteobacteria bacterium]|nr:MAG: hypothetical protein EOO52_14350 [Gammaproteobacteria bacterium]